MSDHGLIKAVRQNLLKNPLLNDFKTYTVVPPHQGYPFLLLNFQQMWTAYTGHPVLERKRVIFSIQLWTQGAILMEPHRVMAAILKVNDGTKLSLEETHQATLRFLKSEGASTDRQGVRIYKQHFEAMIA